MTQVLTDSSFSKSRAWIRNQPDVVIGVAATLAAARAGSLYFTHRVGWIAGLLLAVYPPAIFFDGIIQKVREGQPLWKSLEETTVMSDLAVEMVKVGESTGALVEMLQNASEFYDEEIEVSLSRAMSLIEPTILVILGVVIAVLLYAFYLPLFQLTSVAQQ